jgi:hypothetical protein
MFATRRRLAAVAFELAVDIYAEIIGLQESIHRLAAGARRAAAGCRLHHDQRRFFLRRHLGGRQPALL